MNTRILMALSLATALSAGAIYSQPGPGGPGPEPECRHDAEHHRRFEKELGLTEEQREKLKQIHDERRQEREKHIAKMKKVREKMKEELAREKPDGDKLIDYAAQTADLVEEMTKSRIEHLLKIKKILNKEQFQKLLSREMHPKGPRHHNGPDGGKGTKRHHGGRRRP